MINDNNYALDHPAEQTILQPKETSFRVEAWLEGTNFVQTQHPEEDFRFSSHCYSNQDHQIVAELLEQAMTTVRLKALPGLVRMPGTEQRTDAEHIYAVSYLHQSSISNLNIRQSYTANK